MTDALYHYYHVGSGTVNAAIEAQLRIWYDDAVANGEVDPGLTDLQDIMNALEDTGQITFYRVGRAS